jgi:hypothetical protein
MLRRLGRFDTSLVVRERLYPDVLAAVPLRDPSSSANPACTSGVPGGSATGRRCSSGRGLHSLPRRPHHDDWAPRLPAAGCVTPQCTCVAGSGGDLRPAVAPAGFSLQQAGCAAGPVPAIAGARAVAPRGVHLDAVTPPPRAWAARAAALHEPSDLPASPAARRDARSSLALTPPSNPAGPAMLDIDLVPLPPGMMFQDRPPQ